MSKKQSLGRRESIQLSAWASARATFGCKTAGEDKINSSATDYSAKNKRWSQVSNTRLRWYKANTYGGGTRYPLIVSWPNRNFPKEQLFEQYSHAIDVTPTKNIQDCDVVKTDMLL